MQELKKKLAGSLIVSCQPVVGGPLDRVEIVVGFALAALAGGARGLRIEGAANVAAVRAATKAPIIGLIKRDLGATPVRITPLIEDVVTLDAAGADIIAFDATDRMRPVAASELCKAIHAAGKLAMADISSFDEAEAADALNVDLIGTTLAGYAGGPEPREPDLDLVRRCVSLRKPVIAEGRIRTPEQAAAAIDAGAHAVVVGSAITRPEHIAGWFGESIGQAMANQQMTGGAS